MAVLSGLASPIHALLIGKVVDLFIAYDISVRISSDANDTSATTTEYFCNTTETTMTVRLAEFLNSTDPGRLLQSDVGIISLYYTILALAMMVTSFVSALFWNLSAYRQTHRLRQAFFQAILKQEIGWFDVTSSAQLSSRLSE